MTGYVVARIVDGSPYDWLHSVSEDGSRHMICTSQFGAMRFDNLDAAADEAGRCMDRQPGEEYGAVKA